MIEKPVFISGFRSGTTLLINLLGMHADLAPWFETKGLCEAMRWLYVLKNPQLEDFESDFIVPEKLKGFTLEAVTARLHYDLANTDARLRGALDSGKASHERYPIGNDCAGYSLADAEALLLQWQSVLKEEKGYKAACEQTGKLIRALGNLHQQSLNKNTWINKTPEIGRFANELRDSLGSVRIIYMVRNGLDVVSSANKLGWGGIEGLAYHWQGLLDTTRTAMQDYPEDYLELRYEDLVQNPEETLNAVLTFVGHSPNAGKIIEEFRARLGSLAFDTSRLHAGQNLKPEDVKKFTEVAGQMQRSLGYAL